MALKNKVLLWSAAIGDVLLNALQSAAIGASFGNGAAQFGQDPNNPLQMGDDGNLFVGFPTTSTPQNVQPASTGADVIMAILTIPKSAFDLAFRGVSVLAAGNAPTTGVRTMKLIANPTNPVVGQTVSGGTTIATASNTAAQAGSAGGWEMAANLFKTGSPGSNSQIAIHESGQVGSIIATLTAPSTTAFNESNAITIAVTGNAGVVTDIVLNFTQVFAMN